MVRGRLGYRLEGREGVAGPGQHLHVPHGTTHEWWNAGEEEARIIVEISPAARFEEMFKNLLGLAQDGKTDAKGRPRLLQAALFAREFEDVIRLTKPPRPVQRLLFGALAPVARLLGYRGELPRVPETVSAANGRGGAVARLLGVAAIYRPKEGGR